jgi:hypothetical protein
MIEFHFPLAKKKKFGKLTGQGIGSIPENLFAGTRRH